jgi:hypothetical protein
MELNIFPIASSYKQTGTSGMPDNKNDRVQLEMKILKARQLARQSDDTTRQRLEALALELEQKLREIDE